MSAHLVVSCSLFPHFICGCLGYPAFPFFLFVSARSSVFLSYLIMPQHYQPVAHEEHSPTSLEGSSEDEKFQWTSERRLSSRIQTVGIPHWTWIAQAVMFSASIGFFAVGICMRSAKQPDSAPMTWCEYLAGLKLYASNKQAQLRSMRRYPGKSNTLIFHQYQMARLSGRGMMLMRCGSGLQMGVR
jgi:hypothetical protein